MSLHASPDGRGGFNIRENATDISDSSSDLPEGMQQALMVALILQVVLPFLYVMGEAVVRPPRPGNESYFDALRFGFDGATLCVIARILWDYGVAPQRDPGRLRKVVRMETSRNLQGQVVERRVVTWEPPPRPSVGALDYKTVRTGPNEFTRVPIDPLAKPSPGRRLISAAGCAILLMVVWKVWAWVRL